MRLFGMLSAEKSHQNAEQRRLREETLGNQSAAADPAVSAWVSANAGTGKTHVLTNRILRLLLAGTPPERILALTYTKAAAAEMSKRVFQRLAEWVVASGADLDKKLAELLGRAPTREELRSARQLFALAIETPGGLKVQTIHAFCERLLQRFPLEAGVPPGFTILDDQQRQLLVTQAMDEMLAEATGNKSGPLWPALEAAVAYAVDDTFERALSEAFKLVSLTDQFSFDSMMENCEGRLREMCGVQPESTQEGLAAELSAALSESMMPRLAEALRLGKKTDQERAENLRVAIGARSTGTRAAALEDLFLGKDKKPRSRMFTKDIGDAWPALVNELTDAQQRFVKLHKEQQALTVVEATVALLRLGIDALGRYLAAKARLAALDFDDLVARTATLLHSSEAVEWVLFKLDGGLDHILVDEAQDTNPAQWQVIRSLADEFFSGLGARDTQRTLFAVGDEKQSIYGFQGAAPKMFAAMGKNFAAGAAQSKIAWKQIPLTLSFRSVEPLLAAVDRIFADPTRTPGVGTSGAPVKHVAHRFGHAGLIEIWPTEKSQPADTLQPWAPLAETMATSPVTRLAARIANTIKAWLEKGERLPSEDRRVRAGDILILVCKRMPFAPAMVSALKARNIPVAGADRLVLTEQIAVQDLVALGDFLTLPQDDLALASVLKSPLFDLTDDHLLQLAPGRPGTLWQALVDRAATDNVWCEVSQQLGRWQTEARRLSPFDFYSSLLDRDAMRLRMLARLGSEAADALDEFVNQALVYETTAPPSLQGFLGAMRDRSPEIKRDMEQGRDEVRVMTVHGAKGLEAPIVFLPDTCSTRSGRRPGGLLALAGSDLNSHHPASFLWPVRGTNNVAAVENARQQEKQADREERDRLLYVALTRARDRLYIAGFEGLRDPPADCWYNLIAEDLGGSLTAGTAADGGPVSRLSSTQTTKPEASKSRPPEVASATVLPAWLNEPIQAEPRIGAPLRPSLLAPLERDQTPEPEGGAQPRGSGRPSVPPPSALVRDHRFLRGTLTHALLEYLPTVEERRWGSTAEAFVSSHAAQLSVDIRSQIVDETLAVLRHPELAPLFGPDSYAEVPIVAVLPRPGGMGPPLHVAGKIDRLVRTADAILIVDFKTNRPPPFDVSGVAEAYLLQLAAYRLAVARTSPGMHVRAALLWTDGARIMEIPSPILDEHESRLWTLERATLDA